MTPTELAHQVVQTRRYTRWRVFSGRLFLAAVPSETAGLTEGEALAWAAKMFPQRPDVRVEGVR